MRRLRLLRRALNGLPCMLLAAMMLFARLVAPAMAMPIALDDPLSQVVLCHTDASGEAPASTDHSGQHDCLLCPACHLVSQAVLPTPTAPGLPGPTLLSIGLAAPLPPATGPPNLIRTAAQPTGPPRLSA